MARTHLYRNGVLEAENFPVADVSDHLADPTSVVWLDMCNPTVQELATINEELSLQAYDHREVPRSGRAPRMRPNSA
jgi:magnesium transporter